MANELAQASGYGDLLREVKVPKLQPLVAEISRVKNLARLAYGYLAFYRTYPQIVARPLLEEKVRTLSAQFPDAPAIDPENLIGRLSYSHLEQLVELENPLQRRFYEIETLRGNWSVRELKRQPVGRVSAA